MPGKRAFFNVERSRQSCGGQTCSGGFWNGITAWILFTVHVFGAWEQFPFYNEARSGNWYDFGFLLGAGSPLLGASGGRSRGGSSRRGG